MFKRYIESHSPSDCQNNRANTKLECRSGLSAATWECTPTWEGLSAATPIIGTLRSPHVQLAAEGVDSCDIATNH